MKAKKIFLILLIGVSLWLQNLSANAVACQPKWDGTRTVEANCDLPASGRIYGDITVWPYTVTVPTWTVLWINLATNKVTFTTWKILFQWTAKMDASVSNRFSVAINYVVSGWVTNCPAGMSVLNAWQTGFEAWVNYVSGAGTMYCATP